MSAPIELARCTSLDTEWHSITGELACLQTCDLRADGSTSEPLVLAAWPGACDEAASRLRADLLDPRCALMGHNIAGDLLKCAEAWGLEREVEAAYAAGRVRCTYLAQLLINVAWPGRPKWIWLPAEAEEAEGDDETDPDAPGHHATTTAGRRGFWALRKFAPHATLGEIEISDDDEEGGRGTRVKSGLGDLLLRYLGLDVSADKKGADSWRLRYGELIGIPVDEWPAEALRYAREDPVHTAMLRVAQVRRPPHPYDGQWCSVFYPRPGSPPWAALRCEKVEAWAHAALLDMSGPGLMLDSPRVVESRARLHKVAEVAERVAVGTGVVRLDVHHDADAAKDQGLAVLAVSHDAAAGKAAGLSPAEVRELFRAARDAAAAGRGLEVRTLAELHPWIRVEVKRDASAIREIFETARRLAASRDAAGLAALRAEHPWISVSKVKDDGEVRARAIEAYKAAGWRELPKTDSGAISAGADNLIRVVGPGDRAASIAEAAQQGADLEAAGDAFDAAAEDLRALMGPELLARLQAWTDSGELDRIERALRVAADPGLASHLARQKAQTFDTSFLKPIDPATREARRVAEAERYQAAVGRILTPSEGEVLRIKWAAEGPARYGISPFKSTSRVGYRGDLRQNIPGEGGVRECYVARPGWILVATDYAACELSCQADNLDELVVRAVLREDRHSVLGQAIRNGDDCHLRVVAQIRGEPYAEIAAFYKATKRLGQDAELWAQREFKIMDRQRRGAKEANFGFWGGMGPRKFAFLQARKGNPISEGEAKHLRTNWILTWEPEASIYFRLANEATTSGGMLVGATVVHARDGHVRGGVDYCQWSNTHFQYRAARGAKWAGIILRRACKFDRESPLFGRVRPLVFIHDEYLCEVEESAVAEHDALTAFAAGLPKGSAARAEAEAELGRRSVVEGIGRNMRAGMAKVVSTPVKTEFKICRPDDRGVSHWSK